MGLCSVKWIVFFIVIFAWRALCETSFLNELQQPVDFNCDPGHAISRIESELDTLVASKRHVGGNYDRRWNFDCTLVSKYGKEYCEHFEMINTPLEPILFQCPKNSYMAGIKSIYTLTTIDMSDRVWDVKCCRALGKCTRDCCLSDASTPGEDFDYSPAEEGVFFTGIFSKYSKQDEDRSYYLEQCRAVQCGPPSYLLKYVHLLGNKKTSSGPQTI